MCSVPGCDGEVMARGWCRKHYRRWYAHGDPEGGAAYRNRPVAERFWEKVDVRDGCWEWLGTIDGNGYGRFRADPAASMASAHRVSYELNVGPIPDGLSIDHLCRNRSCVNPAHLEPVTHAENMRRGIHAGSKRTHCPRGHPYEGVNLYIDKTGRRHCRACRREARRRHRERQGA